MPPKKYNTISCEDANEMIESLSPLPEFNEYINFVHFY